MTCFPLRQMPKHQRMQDHAKMPTDAPPQDHKDHHIYRTTTGQQGSVLQIEQQRPVDGAETAR